MKIAIIKHAGSTQANLVLKGVYGAIEQPGGAAPAQNGTFSRFMNLLRAPAAPPAPQVPQENALVEQADGNRSFKVAPEFARVSHLFEYLDGGVATVDIHTLDEIEVPDNLADTFKANLMHQLGGRWENLYGGVIPAGIDTMTKALLEGESRRVQQGVRSYLESQSMQVFMVEASVRAQSRYGSDSYTSTDDLLAGMVPEADAQAEILGAEAIGTDLLGHTYKEPVQLANNVSEANAPRPWVFQGRHAAGTMVFLTPVVARNASDAKAVTAWLLNDNSMREKGIAQTLTISPQRVENVSPGEEFVPLYDREDEWDHENE